MGDPYRPSNYYAPTQGYASSQYAPPVPDAYASGALTTRRHSNPRDDGYYPSQSNMQLSQSSYRPTPSNRRSSDYLDPNGHSSRHHHKSSRSRSRHRSDDKDGRSRSKSRGKEWGATAAGAAAGGLLGNELGHGPLAALAGVAAGAYGAHQLERQHEKHQVRSWDAPLRSVPNLGLEVPFRDNFRLFTSKFASQHQFHTRRSH